MGNLSLEKLPREETFLGVQDDFGISTVPLTLYRIDVRLIIPMGCEKK